MYADYSDPVSMTCWFHAAIVELQESITSDLLHGRYFALQTRARQVEEVYIRALYIMFVAAENELPHIISGDLPNSVTTLYREVNTRLFNGRAKFEEVRHNHPTGPYTTMDFLHSGGHASLKSIWNAAMTESHPDGPPNLDPYMGHLATYCDHLSFVHEKFESGMSKQDVKVGLMALHGVTTTE